MDPLTGGLTWRHPPAVVSGLASGLDTTSIIQQLMSIEQQPQNALKAKQNSDSTTLAVYQQLNTLFANVSTAATGLTGVTDWKAMAATSSSANVTAYRHFGGQRRGALLHRPAAGPGGIGRLHGDGSLHGADRGLRAGAPCRRAPTSSASPMLRPAPASASERTPSRSPRPRPAPPRPPPPRFGVDDVRRSGHPRRDGERNGEGVHHRRRHVHRRPVGDGGADRLRRRPHRHGRRRRQAWPSPPPTRAAPLRWR